MAFKEQLTKLRKRKKLTQTELAEMLGVKQYVVSSWEIGRSEPNISQIVMLSDILEAPVDYLLDKPVIMTTSDEEFEKAIRNVNRDAQDSFINDVYNLCKNLSDEKKEKLLNIIKDVKEF